MVRPMTPPPMMTTSALPLIDGIWLLSSHASYHTDSRRDGIGPEVASNVVRIIEASGVEIQWETHYAGAQALEKFGETLPQGCSIRFCATRSRSKVRSRRRLAKVYFGQRRLAQDVGSLREPAPVRALPNVPCRYPELDLIVVRENTESLYAGLEHVVVPGVVESLKIITEKASTRIARLLSSMRE